MLAGTRVPTARRQPRLQRAVPRHLQLRGGVGRLRAAELGLALIHHLLRPSAPRTTARRRLPGRAGSLVPRPAPRLRPLDRLPGQAAEARDIPGPLERPLARALGHGSTSGASSDGPSEKRHTAVESPRTSGTNQILTTSAPRSASRCVGRGGGGGRRRALGYPVVVKPSTAITAAACRSTCARRAGADRVREGLRAPRRSSSRPPGGAGLPHPGVNGKWSRWSERCRAASWETGSTTSPSWSTPSTAIRGAASPREGADPPELDHQRSACSSSGAERGVGAAGGGGLYLRSTGNLSPAARRSTRRTPSTTTTGDGRARGQAIGLDVGGVDYIAPDIARSYQKSARDRRDQRRPASACTWRPPRGPADAAGPVIDMLFRRDAVAHPIAAITGTTQDHHHAQWGTSSALRAHVGMTTSDGVYIDGV